MPPAEDKPLREREAITELTAEISVLNQIIKRESQEIDTNKLLISDLKLGLKKAKLEAQDSQIELDEKCEEFEDMMEAEKGDFEEQFSQANQKYKALKAKFLDLTANNERLQTVVDCRNETSSDDERRHETALKDERFKNRQLRDDLENEERKHEKQLQMERSKYSELESQLKQKISEREAEIHCLELQKAEITKDLEEYARESEIKLERQLSEKEAEFDLLEERLEQESRASTTALSEGYARLKSESTFATEQLEHQLALKTDEIRSMQTEVQKDRFGYENQIRTFKEEIAALEGQVQTLEAAKPVRTTFDSLAVAVQNENAELHRTVSTLTQELQANEAQLKNVQEEYGMQIKQVEDDLKLKFQEEAAGLTADCDALRFERGELDKRVEQITEQLEQTEERLMREESNTSQKLSELEARMETDASERLKKQQIEFDSLTAKLKREQSRMKEEFEAETRSFAIHGDFSTEELNGHEEQSRQQLIETKMEAEEILSETREEYETRLSQAVQETKGLQERIAQLLDDDSSLRQQLRDEREEQTEQIEELQEKFKQERDNIEIICAEEIDVVRETASKREEELQAMCREMKSKLAMAQTEAQADTLLLRRENEALQLRLTGEESALRKAYTEKQVLEEELEARIAELLKQVEDAENSAEKLILEASGGESQEIATLQANFEESEAASRREFTEVVEQLEADNKELRDMIAGLNRDNAALQTEKQRLLSEIRFEKEQEVMELKGENNRLSRELEVLEGEMQRETNSSKARVSEILEQSRLHTSMTVSRIEQFEMNLSQASPSAQLGFTTVELRHENSELEQRIIQLEDDIFRLKSEIELTENAANERVSSAEKAIQEFEARAIEEEDAWLTERQKLELDLHMANITIQNLNEGISKKQDELSSTYQKLEEMRKNDAQNAAKMESVDNKERSELSALIQEFYTAEQEAARQSDSLRREFETKEAEQHAKHTRASNEQLQEIKNLQCLLQQREESMAQLKAKLRELDRQLMQQQEDAQKAQQHAEEQLQQAHQEFERVTDDLRADFAIQLEIQRAESEKSASAQLSAESDLQRRLEHSFGLKQAGLVDEVSKLRAELVAASSGSNVPIGSENSQNAQNAQKLQEQRLKCQKQQHTILHLEIGLREALGELEAVKFQLTALRADAVAAGVADFGGPGDVRGGRLASRLEMPPQAIRALQILREEAAAQQEQLDRLSTQTSVLLYSINQVVSEQCNSDIKEEEYIERIGVELSHIPQNNQIETREMQRNWIERARAQELQAEAAARERQEVRAGEIRTGLLESGRPAESLDLERRKEIEALYIDNVPPIVEENEELAQVERGHCQCEAGLAVLNDIQAALRRVDLGPGDTLLDLEEAVLAVRERAEQAGADMQEYMAASEEIWKEEKMRSLQSSGRPRGAESAQILSEKAVWLCDEAKNQLQGLAAAFDAHCDASERAACGACEALEAIKAAENDLCGLFELAHQIQ